jgi:hypothetical protein
MPVRKCANDIYNCPGFDLLSGAAHHWIAALFGEAADLGHD